MPSNAPLPGRWQLFAAGVAKTLYQLPGWVRLPHNIAANATVPEDFVGINVATSDDPRCDDYVLARLQELGLQHVRLYYSYDSVDAPAQRLLERLLDAGYRVLLVLLPAREEAALLGKDASAQARWSTFVTQVLKRYGQRIDALEIGSTPNRGRWSGFSESSYLAAWQLATTAAEPFDLVLAGPNVSDFEPVSSIGLLGAMEKIGRLPSIHTDNLFVERVIEPEAYDLRIADRFTARLMKLNLTKKIAVLASISAQFQVPQTYCTYTAWSRKRLLRWSMLPERKNAHYLMRYLVVAAAGGALNRVYWSPLIDQRDGVIACQDEDYPEVDNVSYYRRVRGKVDAFTPTAAFHALGFCARLLSGARCVQAHTNVNGIHHFAFVSESQAHWHVMWCADRRMYALRDLYDVDALNSARAYSPVGALLPDQPRLICEEPLVLRWDEAIVTPTSAQLEAVVQQAVTGVNYWPLADVQMDEFQNAQWRGAIAIAAAGGASVPPTDTIPALLPTLTVAKTLRDKRNKLWNVATPWWSDGQQTIKLNRAKGLKRFTYRFLPSKGRRHWNNANEILRLGIGTPQPLGFFEQPDNSAADSYYVCAYVEDAFSCRDLFTAFQGGATEYRGVAKEEWLVAVGTFVAQMHERGIIHRDLSSGNLMMTRVDGETTFYLIDIGRALISRVKAKSAFVRFKDLNRICYKLAWPDRERLLAVYAHEHGSRLPKWWRQSLASYDWKQRSKKRLKGSSPKRTN